MTENLPGPVAPTAPSAYPGRARRRLLVALGLAAVALVVVVVVRAVLVTPFVVVGPSMEPALEPGDRILVERGITAADLRRGDVVVVDGEAAFSASASRTPLENLMDTLAGLVGLGSRAEYVKRVIGLPGERVRCCDADGRLLVDGRPLVEPWVHPGDAPSDVTFDVTVPPGRVWVLGDHRSLSEDSRSYLGAPGGGMVADRDVVGRLLVRYWPPDRGGSLDAAPPAPSTRNGH